jgi:hypothetical protein
MNSQVFFDFVDTKTCLKLNFQVQRAVFPNQWFPEIIRKLKTRREFVEVQFKMGRMHVLTTKDQIN